MVRIDCLLSGTLLFVFGMLVRDDAARAGPYKSMTSSNVAYRTSDNSTRHATGMRDGWRNQQARK